MERYGREVERKWKEGLVVSGVDGRVDREVERTGKEGLVFSGVDGRWRSGGLVKGEVSG